MVQIVDFAADAGYTAHPRHLAAYDVEKHAWGGRTLQMWAILDPVGQWVQCEKPNDTLPDQLGRWLAKPRPTEIVILDQDHPIP